MTTILVLAALMQAPPASDKPAKTQESTVETPKTTPKPAKTTESALWWRFRGTLSDGAGTVRFRMRGQRVSHASAVINGKSFVLRPSPVDAEGRFSLNGKHEKDYIKIKARVRRGGRWISGSYFGAQNRKRTEGRFTASRR